MRVLLDTDILISYLLSSQPDTTSVRIIRAAAEERFTLLLPDEILDELARKLIEKRDVAGRITPHNAQLFVTLLRELGEALPSLETPIPAIARDPKDDFLYAHAILAQADCLVTGDEDLLALSHRSDIRILTPAAFAHTIKA